jgi:hypothetical protein
MVRCAFHRWGAARAVTELSLADKIVAVDSSLEAARIRHAFGGALALAYYAEPRATIDIDVNVFVEPAEFSVVARAVAALGVDTEGGEDDAVRDGQCRLRWDQTPVDVFFAYDPVHGAMERASRRVPFGDRRIPILSAEHLIVCKAAFDRPKDWIDIEQVILLQPALARGEVLDWLRRLLGPKDRRTVRVDALLTRLLG